MCSVSLFLKSVSRVMYYSVKINVVNNGMHTWGNTDAQRTQWPFSESFLKHCLAM